MLKDYQSEINKCSKCGLCQSVCPIYKITGNDCAVSRGKFVMLDGVLKGDLKLNKNIEKYLDLCLKCGKCETFCPSSIDVCKIFETAKYECAKTSFKSKIIFFLESKYVFGTFIKIFSNINKIFKKSSKQNNPKALKLLYFKGCVNEIFPQTVNFIKTLPNIEIIEKDFDCCGLPFLSSGNLDRFEEVKQHNLSLINGQYDYILTDCSSCESTLKEYFTPHLPQGAREPVFINLGELIVKQNLKFKFPKHTKVTFHKPCHLNDDSFLEQLLKNCENVEYIKMENYDDCCGFAGEFALKNRKLSALISNKKAQNIIKTKADFVITTCPSCILGLKQGLFRKKNAPKVLSLSDFLKKAKLSQ